MILYLEISALEKKKNMSMYCINEMYNLQSFGSIYLEIVYEIINMLLMEYQHDHNGNLLYGCKITWLDTYGLS